jgi:hypothetical protein
MTACSTNILTEESCSGNRPKLLSVGTVSFRAWKDIAGTRDHLSHGYGDVDYQVLWDAVQNDVPALLITVEQMLKDLG